MLHLVSFMSKQAILMLILGKNTFVSLVKDILQILLKDYQLIYPNIGMSGIHFHLSYNQEDMETNTELVDRVCSGGNILQCFDNYWRFHHIHHR